LPRIAHSGLFANYNTMWLFYLLIFIFGLTVGSFLNSVIYRLGKESFLKGRSYCPHCDHKLSWKDLIPLLSYLSLKGKCRYCNEKISWQYPAVELSTGLLFLFLFWRGLPKLTSYSLLFQTITVVFGLIIVACLVVIFVYDLKHFIIPDPVLLLMLLAIGAWFLTAFSFGFLSTCGIANRFLSGLLAALPFLLIVLASGGKLMGMGDVKYLFIMGLLLGWPQVVIALFFAFVIGGIMGIGLIALQKKSLKSKLPFGPLLVIGTLIAWSFGPQILSWYLNILYV